MCEDHLARRAVGRWVSGSRACAHLLHLPFLTSSGYFGMTCFIQSQSCAITVSAGCYRQQQAAAAAGDMVGARHFQCCAGPLSMNLQQDVGRHVAGCSRRSATCSLVLLLRKCTSCLHACRSTLKHLLYCCGPCFQPLSSGNTHTSQKDSLSNLTNQSPAANMGRIASGSCCNSLPGNSRLLNVGPATAAAAVTRQQPCSQQ